MDRLDALRLFVRLGERRSFTAAARDLRIKQSTASKWVAELEAQMGVGLVERTTRSLHLTDAGRTLLARATEILAAFDDLTHELQQTSAEPVGRVRVSAPVAFGRRYVAPLVAEFLRRHPQVEVELALNDRYVNLVEEGFDLAVRVGLPADTSARGRKLADGERRLVASPGYLKAHGRPKSPRDLRRHECLVHGDASSPTIWRFARGAGPEVAVPVRGRVAANHSEAVATMARAGLGVALLADWLVADDLRRGRLVQLLKTYRTPPAPAYAMMPPGRYLSPAVRALVEHLATSLADQMASAA